MKHFFLLTSIFLFTVCAALSQNSFVDNNAKTFSSSDLTHTVTIPVSGIDNDDILRQVRLKFGDGSGMYVGDLANVTIELYAPSGEMAVLINPSNFVTIGDADRQYLNITLRDHDELYTPGNWASATGNTISNAYPFNYGYWKSVDKFNFSGDYNGDWEIKIQYSTIGFGSRKYIESELVFGDEFEFEDIRGTKPNQSCTAKKCIETGTIYLATNQGYPNGQSEIPLTIGGCQWNAEKNNAAWFSFVASSSEVELSISGMSAKIEPIVLSSTDCCSGFNVVNGGCPTEMYNATKSYTQYFKQTYAGGYSQNHGFSLTGLTVGQEYTLILDGLDGNPPTSSEMYIEIESGADEGCESQEEEEQTLCENSTVGDLSPATATWYDSESSTTPLDSDAVLVDGETYYYEGNGGGCESTGRIPVEVTLDGSTSTPTADSPQQFCNEALVSDLIASGDQLTWYDENGNELNETDELEDGTTIYVTQSDEDGNCESNQVAVEVVIDEFPDMITLYDGLGEICEGSTTTFIPNVLGGDWISSEPDIATVDDGVVTGLEEGTTLITYTAYGTGACEDLSQDSYVWVTVNPTPEPPMANNQSFCEGAVMGDLEATGTDIHWYDEDGNSLSDNPLNQLNPLVDGETYYATQTIEGCESDQVAVEVEVSESSFSVSSSDISSCGGADGTIIISGLNNNTDYDVSYNNEPSTTMTTNGDGEIEITDLGPGTYSNFVVDGEGNCNAQNGTEVTLSENDGSVAPTDVEGGGDYCDGDEIVLTSIGGEEGDGGVHVWYAAEGEEENDTHDGCDEDFVELWNEFDNYNSSLQNITFPHHGEFEINNGIISCEVTEEDPWIWMFPLPDEHIIDADVYKYVNVRYRVTNFVGDPNVASQTRMGALFTKNAPVYPTPPTQWGSTSDPTYPYPFTQPEAGSEKEQINIDGQWHVVAIPVHEHSNWFGDITGLRLDFFDPFPHDANNGSTMDIDFVTVSKHPMIAEGQILTLNEGDQFYPPIGATTYYSKIIDNCSPTDCAITTVNIEEKPDAGTISGEEKVCQEEEITFTSDGTTNGEWGVLDDEIASIDANGVVEGMAPGETTVFYVSEGGVCPNDTSFMNITINPLPDAGTIVGDPEVCQESTIILTTDGEENGEWESSNENIATIDEDGKVETISDGTVTISYSVTNECGTSTATFELTSLEELDEPTADATQTFCEVATVADLTVTGNNINWYDENDNLLSETTALEDGETYYATQTEGDCESEKTTVTVTINNISAPTATATQSFCETATIADLAVNGDNIQWYDENNNILNSTTSLENGKTYYATQSNEDCESEKTTVLVDITTVAAPTAQATQTFCETAAVGNLIANGNGIKWYDENDNLLNSSTPLENGNTYYATASQGDCESDKIEVTVAVGDLTNVATSTSDVSCSGENDGSASVTVNGTTQGYSFSWNDSNNQTTATAENLAAGSYTVTITDNQTGCETTANATVQAPNPISITENITEDICGEGEGAIQLSVSGGQPDYNIAWSNGQTGTSISNLSGGNYTATVTDVNGCTAEKTFSINVSGGLDINIVPGNATVFAGDEVDLFVEVTNASGNESYSWSPTEGLSCADCPNPIANPSSTTQYTVTVTDENGCSETDQVTVHIQKECKDFYIPNMFTPNGDGRNDVFRVYGNKSCIKSYRLQIFDRWGEVLFETKEFTQYWDGKFRGKKINTGVYVYKVIIETIQGETINESGNVNLIR